MARDSGFSFPKASGFNYFRSDAVRQSVNPGFQELDFAFHVHRQLPKAKAQVKNFSCKTNDIDTATIISIYSSKQTHMTWWMQIE